MVAMILIAALALVGLGICVVVFASCAVAAETGGKDRKLPAWIPALSIISALVLLGLGVFVVTSPAVPAEPIYKDAVRVELAAMDGQRDPDESYHAYFYDRSGTDADAYVVKPAENGAKNIQAPASATVLDEESGGAPYIEIVEKVQRWDKPLGLSFESSSYEYTLHVDPDDIEAGSDRSVLAGTVEK